MRYFSVPNFYDWVSIIFGTVALFILVLFFVCVGWIIWVYVECMYDCIREMPNFFCYVTSPLCGRSSNRNADFLQPEDTDPFASARQARAARANPRFQHRIRTDPASLRYENRRNRLWPRDRYPYVGQLVTAPVGRYDDTQLQQCIRAYPTEVMHETRGNWRWSPDPFTGVVRSLRAQEPVPLMIPGHGIGGGDYYSVYAPRIQASLRNGTVALDGSEYVAASAVTIDTDDTASLPPYESLQPPSYDQAMEIQAAQSYSKS